MGLGRMRRVRRGSVRMSPPVRRLRAIARRRSTRDPRPRIHRRVRRSPGLHTSRSSASRARTISSALNSPKSLSASVPTSLHVCSNAGDEAPSSGGSTLPADGHSPDSDDRGSRPPASAHPARACCVPCGRARTCRTRDRTPRADRGDAPAAHDRCDRPRRETPGPRAAVHPSRRSRGRRARRCPCAGAAGRRRSDCAEGWTCAITHCRSRTPSEKTQGLSGMDDREPSSAARR